MSEEIETISIKFGDLEGIKTGKTSFYFWKPTIITLSEITWLGMSERSKLFLLAHEVGHALLNRKKHQDQKTTSGECLSIMRERGCSCNFYSDLWYDYYFDELFEEDTPLPDWYSDSLLPSDDFQPHYEISTIGSKFSVTDTVQIDIERDFILKLEINSLALDAPMIFLWDWFIMEHKLNKLFFLHSSIGYILEGYYYVTDLPSDVVPIKLEFVKKDELFYIYLDDERLHMFEYEAIDKYRDCDDKYKVCDLIILWTPNNKLNNSLSIGYLD